MLRENYPIGRVFGFLLLVAGGALVGYCFTIDTSSFGMVNPTETRALRELYGIVGCALFVSGVIVQIGTLIHVELQKITRWDCECGKKDLSARVLVCPACQREKPLR